MREFKVGLSTRRAFKIAILPGLIAVLLGASAGFAGAGNWSVAYDTPEGGVYCLAVYNGKLFAGTGTDGKIYVYDGNSWEVSYDSYQETIMAFAVYDGKLYAAGEPNESIFVYDGEEWTEMEEVPGDPVLCFGIYGGKLYAGTQSGVFVYEGGTWSQVLEYGMASFAVYNNKLYAGSCDSGAVYSFDGNYWVLVHDLIQPNAILSLTTYRDRLYIGTSDSGAIYVSNGETYALSHDVLEPYVYSLAVYSDKLYAGTGPTGCIYSYNGTVWELNFDTPESDIFSLAVYGTRLYAGTWQEGKIYCLTDFDFSLSASSDNLELAQNSVSTTVSVSLVSQVTETVTLSGAWVGNAPTGVSAMFSMTSGTPPFTSTLTFTKSASAGGGNFTYRVTASGGGLTRTKDISINVIAPPSSPSLLSPENGVTIDTITPTFDWSDVSGTDSYTLEVATDNAFTNVILTKITAESIATLSQSEALSFGTTYYWRVRGSNSAGQGGWSSVWKFIPLLTAPKVSGFMMAGGATFTKSTTIQLTITAQNASHMSFSTDMATWTDWEPYQSNIPYTLSGPDGLKTVYVRVKDSGGNVSPTMAGSITLDQTSPLSQKDLVGDLGPEGYRGSVVITLSAIDATSGVDRIVYRVDGGEWKSASAREVSFPITSGGTHTVEYYSVDMAGNEETVRSFEVKVHVPGAIPEYVWVIPGVAAVAGVAVFYATRGMRLRRRLASIKIEKEELAKMKKEAETKFYKEATMSRETFDSLMAEYRRKMAELEKEEGLLRRKIGKKAKSAGMSGKR
ncbi:MAG: PQQ-binding-like beta-propeller repeat protein [Candidatus Hadarchaeales archaeon]